MPESVSILNSPSGPKRLRNPSRFSFTSNRSYRHNSQLKPYSQTDHGGSKTSRIRRSDWQVLEEKVGANYKNRYIWSPSCVEALVSRDRDTDANGTLDERLFAQHDANFHVTAITNTSGTVQERMTYNPFGAVAFRDSAGSTISVSSKAWDILHQGGQRDSIGNYEFRHRILSPTLGRWLTNDPLGFEAGDNNFYRYVGNGPGNGLDPQGLQEAKKPFFNPFQDIKDNLLVPPQPNPSPSTPPGYFLPPGSGGNGLPRGDEKPGTPIKLPEMPGWLNPTPNQPNPSQPPHIGVNPPTSWGGLLPGFEYTLPTDGNPGGLNPVPPFGPPGFEFTIPSYLWGEHEGWLEGRVGWDGKYEIGGGWRRGVPGSGHEYGGGGTITGDPRNNPYPNVDFEIWRQIKDTYLEMLIGFQPGNPGTPGTPGSPIIPGINGNIHIGVWFGRPRSWNPTDPWGRVDG